MPLGISWEAFVQASSVLWSVNIAAWIDDIALAKDRIGNRGLAAAAKK